MRLTISQALMALSLLCAASAQASEVQCTGECPAGQVMTSYADGNNANCVCAQEQPALPEVEADPEDDPNIIPEY